MEAWLDMDNNETFTQLKKEAYWMFLQYYGSSYDTLADRYPLLVALANEHKEAMNELDWHKVVERYTSLDRILFIKEVRTITGFGLAEAKQIQEKVWAEKGWT